jgi:hypothetical protein
MFKFKRGSTAANNAYTGPAGSISLDTEKNEIRIHDGVTVGGFITGGLVSSVAGKTGVVTLVKSDVGLGSVDNTSDLNKPVSTATQTALNGKLDSSSYTASDVLTKVKTVDGASSGLDADLLDGQEGSFYQNADNLNAGTVPNARLTSATTSVAGIVQLDNTTSSTSTTKAATANALKTAFDKANAAEPGLFRGDTATNNARTGTSGEISVDTQAKELRIHDGSTAGGAKIGGGQMLGTQSVKALFFNAQNVAENTTVPSTVNAFSAGPISIDSGFDVTIEDGGSWIVM